MINNYIIISDKIKHLNDMLNEDDEIINKKTL